MTIYDDYHSIPTSLFKRTIIDHEQFCSCYWLTDMQYSSSRVYYAFYSIWPRVQNSNINRQLLIKFLPKNIYRDAPASKRTPGAHILINLSKPTGYVMHHQFNIQQLYALPTLNLFVLYLSQNKQRLVSLTA